MLKTSIKSKIRVLFTIFIFISSQMVLISNVSSYTETIIINGADDIFEISQVGSNNLANKASEINDRIIVNNADSIIDLNSHSSYKLDSKAQQVEDRIIINYADTIINYDCTHSTDVINYAYEVEQRIIVNSANSCYDYVLIEPCTLHQLFEGPSILINNKDGLYFNSPPLLDVDFVDITGLDDAYYKIDSYTPTGNDITGWMAIFTDFSGTAYFTNFSMNIGLWNSLTEGSHIIYFKTWDDSGYLTAGSLFSWQFYKDTTEPSVMVHNVQGIYYAAPPLLNIDFFDSMGLNSAFYKLDSFTPLGLDTTNWIEIFNNSSTTSHVIDFTLNNTVWSSLTEGFHTIYFKTWDDLGNINDGQTPFLQFFKDLTMPEITINNPNGTLFSKTSVIDVDFLDPAGLEAAYYKVDSYMPAGTDITNWIEIFNNYLGNAYTSDFLLEDSIWNGLSEDLHKIYFKVWDNLGNINDRGNPSLEIIKDSTAPSIIVNTPQSSYYTEPPSFEVQFDDLNGLNCAYYKVNSYLPLGKDITGWINIFEDASNSSYISNIKFTEDFWSSVPDGFHKVYLKCWDDAGNVNDGNIPYWEFFKYSGIPIITVNQFNGSCFNQPPMLDVDFFDPTALDAAYYKVDSFIPLESNITGWTLIFDNLNNNLYTNNFTLNSDLWTLLSEGSHIIYFKAWNNSYVINDGDLPCLQFYKDTIPPTITLLSPNENQVYQSSVPIQIEFIGHSNCYFRWESGVYSLTSTTIFNLPHSDGLHTLYLKATDNAGNFIEEDYSFLVDDTPPTAQIQGMKENLHVYRLITISVDPSDANGIKHVSFMLDSELLSRQETGYSYRFEPSDYPYGSYIFTIVVEDNAGNVLNRNFNIIIEAPPVNFWENLPAQLVITVITAIIAGFIGIIFTLIKRKLKK
ncbi:MAG: hypothetical protein ACFFKA_03660 [Candidatus Thorarchaeota archaeon]